MLLETYERAEGIDADRAESALQRTQERKRLNETDVIRNDASMLRAINRIKVSKR